MGASFFHWSSDAGEGINRNNVIRGKDTVRVKRCWGIMAAFNATFFQVSAAAHERPVLSESNAAQPMTTVSRVPIRFRAEAAFYREASECCLTLVDLLSVSIAKRKVVTDDVGIYINRTFALRAVHGPYGGSGSHGESKSSASYLIIWSTRWRHCHVSILAPRR